MTHFITFEGIEGSGKSTQIRMLAEHLEKRGFPVCPTREPGGCAIADQIRNVLLHPRNSAMVPRAELLLYAAARAQHVEEVVRPALDQGQIVLCDRFTDATLAYQGNGRNLDRQLILQLNELATGHCRPGLTLLFDLPVEIGLGRARQRETDRQDFSEGRFEQETLSFHQRIRTGYRQMAATEPDRFRNIDAMAPVERVFQQVTLVVENFLTQQELIL